jgi:hypothetical protein
MLPVLLTLTGDKPEKYGYSVSSMVQKVRAAAATKQAAPRPVSPLFKAAAAAIAKRQAQPRRLPFFKNIIEQVKARKAAIEATKTTAPETQPAAQPLPPPPFPSFPYAPQPQQYAPQAQYQPQEPAPEEETAQEPEPEEIAPEPEPEEIAPEPQQEPEEPAQEEEPEVFGFHYKDEIVFVDEKKKLIPKNQNLPAIVIQDQKIGNILKDIFTISPITPWEVRAAQFIYDKTGDGKLKSFWGAQGWNVSLIDKLFKLSNDSILPSADRKLYMKSNTGTTNAIVDAFLEYTKTPEATKDKPFSIFGMTPQTILTLAAVIVGGIVLIQLVPIIKPRRATA